MKEDRKDKALRQHVLELLRGGGAHAKFDEIVAGIPPEVFGRKPAGLPHSLWMLLEHLRIAQRDILEFSRNPKHVSPKWPRVIGRSRTLRPAHPRGTQASSKSSKT